MIQCGACQRWSVDGTPACICGEQLGAAPASGRDDGAPLSGAVVLDPPEPQTPGARQTPAHPRQREDAGPPGLAPLPPTKRGLEELTPLDPIDADDPFQSLPTREPRSQSNPAGPSPAKPTSNPSMKVGFVEEGQPRNKFAVRPDLSRVVESRAIQPVDRLDDTTADLVPVEPAPDGGSIDQPKPIERSAAPVPVRAGVESLRSRTVGPAAPGPGEIACPNCRHSVSIDRRFCRCGTELRGPVAAIGGAGEAVDETPPARSLWRRLTGTGVGKRGDNRTWDQRAKDAGVRQGMRYGASISSRTRIGRIAMAVLAGGGAMAVIGPLRGEVRRLPDLFSRTDPAVVESAELTFDPLLAPAFTPLGPWLAPWALDEVSLAPAQDDGCNYDEAVIQAAESGVATPEEKSAALESVTISGGFVQPTDVTQLWVEVGETRGVGADAEALGGLVQPVHPPALLRVDVGAACWVLELSDSPERQVFEVDVPGAQRFEIAVLSVHDVAWPVAPIVQIEQITWVQK